MFWIIIIVVILLITRFFYRITGRYKVLSKTTYRDLPNENNQWITMYNGSYIDCVKYINNAKSIGTDSLGFKESFKMERV